MIIQSEKLYKQTPRVIQIICLLFYLEIFDDSLRIEKPTKMTIKQFLKDVIYKNIKDSNGYSIQMCRNTNFKGNDFNKINKIKNLNNEVIKDLIKNKTISSYFYNCDVIGTVK